MRETKLRVSDFRLFTVCSVRGGPADGAPCHTHPDPIRLDLHRGPLNGPCRSHQRLAPLCIAAVSRSCLPPGGFRVAG